MSDPDIYQVTHGSGYDNAEFGTRVGYAPYVIGESEQSVRMGYWWTLKDVARKAKPKIIRLFKVMVERLANFLDGKGML